MSEIYSRQKTSEPKLSIENRFRPHQFPDGVEDLKPGDEIDLSPQSRGEVFKKVVKRGHGIDYPNEGDTCEVKYIGYVGTISDDNIFDSSERDGSNFVFEVARGIDFRKKTIDFLGYLGLPKSNVYRNPIFNYRNPTILSSLP